SDERLKQYAGELQRLLELADFVKFAKMQPKPEVNVKAYDATDEFIENTRPAEIAEDDNATSTAGDETNLKPEN
ncbi:MAG: hypothetical protein K2J07_01105, partial [Muribaculaceae bacterium]|nr:hypothetical protein [Muribaculaceae bacterium]